MSEDWDEFDSGPFCRHWGDPSDCEETCANCSHKRTEHDAEEGESVCMAEDCECVEWVEEGDEDL